MMGCQRGGYSAITRRSNGEAVMRAMVKPRTRKVGGGSEYNNERLPADYHDDGGCEDEGEDECLDNG